VIVAGVMSGTSLDGIDVAIVDIRGKQIAPLAFHSTPYPKLVREALLSISNTMTHTAAISRLNFVVGELYAEAIQCASRKHQPDLIGMHGQTIYHEGQPAEYLGREIASTLQIGEAAVVAERTGVAVVSNFRERDIAAGGQGAPLVPFVDYLLFRHPRRARVALNIGGIANITAIPAKAKPEDVIAFDTGPGNMVIDALVTNLTSGKANYDREGRIARRGQVHERLLSAMMSDPYIDLLPPKSTGRERFGRDFVNGLIATGVALEDLIATATEFTARSIAFSLLRTITPDEVIVSGGGIHNRTLMARLRSLLNMSSLVSTKDFGIDPAAKEAIAFALLAYQTFKKQPANLPSATGAKRAVILGKITHA
jgi:anhydro-N-acetylmuramic acid kinase